MLNILRKLLINRSFTNIISFIIDKLIPPLIRDNKYFMLPFYYFAFKGKNIKEHMNFKSNFYSISNENLEKIYQSYNTIGTERITDLNYKSVIYILKNLDKNLKSLLDVACGKGFLLNKISELDFDITGVDLFDNPNNLDFIYIKANIENLPFPPKSFDIVTSTHTLEHVIDIKKAVQEIKRVAKKQIIIVVPCQRFNYYTLDHHLHFFPKKEMLEGLINIPNHFIKKIQGDWVYIGYLT